MSEVISLMDRRVQVALDAIEGIIYVKLEGDTVTVVINGIGSAWLPENIAKDLKECRWRIEHPSSGRSIETVPSMIEVVSKDLDDEPPWAMLDIFPISSVMGSLGDDQQFIITISTPSRSHGRTFQKEPTKKKEDNDAPNKKERRCRKGPVKLHVV